MVRVLLLIAFVPVPILVQEATAVDVHLELNDQPRWLRDVDALDEMEILLLRLFNDRERPQTKNTTLAMLDKFLPNDVDCLLRLRMLRSPLRDDDVHATTFSA